MKTFETKVYENLNDHVYIQQIKQNPKTPRNLKQNKGPKNLAK